jgi:hypothetical protein
VNQLIDSFAAAQEHFEHALERWHIIPYPLWWYAPHGAVQDFRGKVADAG